MERNNDIEDLLTGKIEMSVFLQKMKTDPSVQLYLRIMIPQDVLVDSSHPILKIPGYPLLERHNYDLFEALHEFRFNDSLRDNFNIFWTLKKYYCYYFPETSCVNHYNEDKDLFWSVSADYYEGPEVEKDIQRILVECRKVSGKGKKRAKAKELIRETFHTEKGKRPYWIQGSEWPRGKYSPMKYICSKRIPDGKVFLFSDVDTGEMREIEQYY